MKHQNKLTPGRIEISQTKKPGHKNQIASLYPLAKTERINNSTQLLKTRPNKNR